VEVIQLKEAAHDFGKIPQGRPANYTFEIVNTGKEPLKLDNVQASCGCTTPQWSKDPIAPGETSKILVGYNAYTEGYFEKTITIQYNQNQSKVLTIKGTVYKAPPAPAPENASVKLLKSIGQ
jgi:archaellum component FlaG (FlaF/FlaG flagellin family)